MPDACKYCKPKGSVDPVVCIHNIEPKQTHKRVKDGFNLISSPKSNDLKKVQLSERGRGRGRGGAYKYVPLRCEKLIDSCTILGVGEGRNPVTPNPPPPDLWPLDEKTSESEDPQQRKCASCVGQHHAPSNTGNDTEQGCSQLVEPEKDENLLEEPVHTNDNSH